MALLKFKGNPEHRVPRAGTYFLGQRPQYLGLEYAEDGTLISSDMTIDDATAEGQKLLVRARRDGAFTPVNEASCAAIGVEFKAPAKEKAVKNV